MWLFLPGTIIATVIGYIVYWFSSWTRKGFRICSNSFDISKQAIEQEDEKGVYRSGFLPHLSGPIDTAVPEITTLYEIFMRGLKMSDNGDCIGYRPNMKSPYHFMSYSDALINSRKLISALVEKCGIQLDSDGFVGIYAKNCREWCLTLLGCMQQTFVIVPLYDTLDANAAGYIVNQTQMEVVVVDTANKVQKLLGDKACPSIKHIIVIEECNLKEYQSINPTVQIHSFNELIKNQEELVPVKLPKPEDKYILCYTSGTTGAPKGVMITHRNVVAAISAIYKIIEEGSPELFKIRMSFVSYLPLSHMMEQLCHWSCFFMGGRIGYYSGTIQGLMDDLKELKPTFFPVVPRLLNRLYDLIHVNLQKSNPLKRTLFNYAYIKKLALLKKGIFCTDTIWDRLIFSKIQDHLGGNVQIMATGSAPINAEVLETCRVVFGSSIIEAYGQTECSAIATLTWLNDHVGGHCGSPATCALIKLADVPEMNYYAAEGKGEIMVKGPCVTSGYFKDPEKTAELFDKDGYLHTGDVGQQLPEGRFKIIDRKKHIFKLAQGEYVAPEKIENVYLRTPCVQQVFVDGDSLESYLVAVVVPEAAVVKEWFEKHVEKNGKSYKEMVETKEVSDYILAEMQRVGKEQKLNSLEQVKAIHVTLEPFTVENGLLTPTMKAKRPELRTFYARTIKELYSKKK